MDVVTEVLSARDGQVDGLPRMVGASVVAHVALLAVVYLAPAWWFGRLGEKEPDNVMTISLGGAPGPRDGGLTPMGGRPIQAAAPIAARPVIEPVRPPAARAPEMIEPTPAARKKPEAKVPDAKNPLSRTPTTGPEVQKGSTVADTGARGQGFGLTSAGGGGTGSYLETANFCCPEYLSTMLDFIRKNWDSKQQGAGIVIVKYTIQPDGTITNILVEKSSGYATLDFLASRALQLTRRFPALPTDFTEPSLTVHLSFEYQR